ncbi:Cyclin-A1-1 [Platanthera guangdongensis]|uniref:Cyclin-A1-1 n=1 Tax=Platanthera guangdongensis TaxID=2320717 RepID=A0ABR2M3N7_9ASPA
MGKEIPCHHCARKIQTRTCPTDFIDKVQKDINGNMRAILIDWLVEVYKFISYC